MHFDLRQRFFLQRCFLHLGAQQSSQQLGSQQGAGSQQVGSQAGAQQTGSQQAGAQQSLHFDLRQRIFLQRCFLHLGSQQSLQLDSQQLASQQLPPPPPIEAKRKSSKAWACEAAARYNRPRAITAGRIIRVRMGGVFLGSLNRQQTKGVAFRAWRGPAHFVRDCGGQKRKRSLSVLGFLQEALPIGIVGSLRRNSPRPAVSRVFPAVRVAWRRLERLGRRCRLQRPSSPVSSPMEATSHVCLICVLDVAFDGALDGKSLPRSSFRRPVAQGDSG